MNELANASFLRTYLCRTSMKLSTSLLTHLGAVAISVTTTALDRVSGDVCGGLLRRVRPGVRVWWCGLHFGA